MIDVTLRIDNCSPKKDVITYDNLMKIKKFILKSGIRQTYCNFYNNNPVLKTQNYFYYLNPDNGSKNMNCELDKSDFNNLTIRNLNSTDQYRNVNFSKKNNVYIKVSWPKKDLTVSEIEKFVIDAIKEILKEIEK